MSTRDPLTVRSLLFVPGGRPEMLAKVARSRPDAVVVDLEDAVAPADKEQARAAASAALREARPGAGTVLVRVNPPGTPWHEADVAAVADLAETVDGAVLPKYERVEQLDRVRSALPPDTRVVVGIESARGVADARPLLEAGPDAAYFGAEDLIADLGGRRTADGTEVLYARSRVCLSAHLAAVPAVDQAVVAVREVERFRTDAEQARDLGYRGKICLHPTQVEAAHAVFTPSAEEVGHAREVLAASGTGVAVIDGQMVDAVHVAMARGVLARAGEA
ncbi:MULTISPECIES: CoA ester lyase [unclassified Pseudonocardia]|uniref:HpcH/HpaI aldolase/citrate lyase family protein n=1 Tax=unclassified Pseudonocardia TaxID=2619320 RepID=UPI0001FFE380|nr:CoA ester lyase [Pseudonocardia sp. Ae707_Ps1]OLM16705.1 Hydroxymethylglutaryl-CoA lyase [Pseudonocardia sp. Ae707_Ps1]